nr:hypothetical protein [uncultured Devosia sp.]
MAIDKNDVHGFFEDYGSTLQARDAKKIARHWATPSFVVSDQGGLSVKDASEVEAFFSASMSQYDGVAEAEATITDVVQLTENVVAVQVEWEHKDHEGATVGGERGFYMLTKNDDGRLAISVYAPRSEA